MERSGSSSGTREAWGLYGLPGQLFPHLLVRAQVAGGISWVAVLHAGSELGLFLAPLCLLCQLHPSPLVSTHTSLCGGMDVPTGIHVIICTREHTKTSLQNAVFSVMFQSP